MFNILTVNSISKLGLNEFDKDRFDVGSETAKPDGIIVRSSSLHEMELGNNLLAIARAGAGYNNIPVAGCSDRGIAVFNTPGGNANAVKELVIASLLISSRKVTQGIEWVKTLREQEDAAALVEKGKKNFVGPEIMNKRLGVIGLGAVGVQVANACEALGMKVIGYDPHISLDAAWSLSRNVEKATGLDALFKSCDYVTVHTPLLDSTRGMFNAATFAKMKKGARLINFSRGEIVDNDAVKTALADGRLSCYVTDFPMNGIIGVEGVIAIPHLGASTPEAEDNCAVMAARQITGYLMHGNVKNSVNLPNCDLGPALKNRITIINRNIPNVIASMTIMLAEKGINIADMINRSKGDWAYNIIDIDGNCSKDVLKQIGEVEGVIRIRHIKPQEA